GLPFFDDPDNESLTVRRNRLRRQLIPQLETDYNPQLRAALARTGALAATDDSALEKLAATVPVLDDGEVIMIPTALLAILDEAIATRVVRRAIRLVRGPHPGTAEEVGTVLEVAAGARAGAELSGKVRVEREGPMVVLNPGLVDPFPPRETAIPATVGFDRWRLQLDVTDHPPPVIGGRSFVLDADQVERDVLVRAATAAERIDVGAGGKRVGDALAEAGISPRLRPRWPVVESGGRIALIPGVRAAAWAWRGTSTTRYLVARIDDTATGEGN
ncbi:MAG: TilS substrate C-terminal domain-containing protein, partial [Acidimicrobiia bacterium]